ncbi:MAG: 2-dehydropantoate 2-reductase [Actinomycetota bacterium]|nr:2-dehydropantoate 2-reductase [Actinomycetota bacterium]
MRFVVYGAGAVGGVVGARLAQHGHDVVLIARGAHHDAIAKSGLRIQSHDEDSTVAIPVVDHPSALTFTADDVVLFAMKSQDTLDAVKALAPAAPPDIAVVSLQNGVANERMLLRAFAAVYAICVMLPATHLDPGVVQASSAPVTGLLDIGRYPTGTDDGAAAIAEALIASSFESVVRPDIMRWKHTKLLMNLGNAAEASCTPGDARNDLVRRLRTEGTACLDAAGIAYASRDEDRERRGERMQIHPSAGALRGGGSSWQSLTRGTGAIETDYLNGEIVLLGREHGVATPANELIRQTANRLARAGAPPGSVDAADLLARL